MRWLFIASICQLVSLTLHNMQNVTINEEDVSRTFLLKNKQLSLSVCHRMG